MKYKLLSGFSCKLLLNVILSITIVFTCFLQAYAGTNLKDINFPNNYIIGTLVTKKDHKINGIVTDKNGKPLIGVTVKIKNSRRGTVTDNSGRFSLEVSDKDILIVSYIGYQTKEIVVGESTHIDIKLNPESSELNQVVVIGYGKQKKATLTGAVSTVSEKQLAGRPVARTTDLLQGLVPGMIVQRSDVGNISGTQTSISIRGVTSRSNPGVLVVIDGIPQVGSAASILDNINPQDIASISVLKDAQAAIYGARAAGGVILVTTKNGTTKKPTINFSYTYTIQKPSLEKKTVNIVQLIQMMNAAYVNAGITTNGYTHMVKYLQDNHLTMKQISKNTGKDIVLWPFDNTDSIVLGNYYWPKIMFHSAPLQVYNLSISGKTSRLNYFNSIHYDDQKSMLRYGVNYNKNFSGRIKNSYKVTNWLKVYEDVDLGRQKVIEPYHYNTVEGWVGLIWPTFMPYTPDGHLYVQGSHQNPIGYAKDGGNITDIYYRINSQIGFVLNPIKNLNVTGQMGNNFSILEDDWANLGFDMYDFNNKFMYNSNQNRNSAGADYDRTRSFVGNLFADYKFTLLKNNNFDFLAGYSHQEDDYRSFSASRNLGLISPQLPTFGLGSSTQQFNGESKTTETLESVFSRLRYNYLGKYIVEANFRYDGSSKFAPGYKWSPFWGVSGAWVISEENFMHHLTPLINFFKIRASWGQLGNDASIGLYDFIPQINIGGSYPFGNAESPALTQEAYITSLASANRSWERIGTKDIGVDFSMIKDRLSGSLDYYIKDNTNMFYSKEFPQVLGVTPPTINGAHLRTKGWEVNLNWKDEIGSIGYSVGFNLSNSTNKIIQLADSRIPVMGENAFVQGYPADSYFGYKFEGLIKTKSELEQYTSNIKSGIPQALQEGDAMYEDLNKDGQLTPELYQVGKDGKPVANSGDMVYLGNGDLHYVFGINLGITWQNFYVSALFQGVLKWLVFDPNRAFIYDSWPQLSYFYDNTWTPQDPKAKYPELNVRSDIGNYNYTVSNAPYRLYNNKYIRLKNIQIGYNIPSRIISKYKIKELKVYFSGTDVYELYNIPGEFNPELPFVYRNGYTPFPRQYAFGINLTF